jgi:hypothetical protein
MNCDIATYPKRTNWYDGTFTRKTVALSAATRSVPPYDSCHSHGPGHLHLPLGCGCAALHGLSPQEVLRQYTPEELATAVSKEQAARLRELLERNQGP